MLVSLKFWLFVETNLFYLKVSSRTEAEAEKVPRKRGRSRSGNPPRNRQMTPIGKNNFDVAVFYIFVETYHL